MTTTKNKYGRQIFLSREEIQYLRGLVYSDIVSNNDHRSEALGRLEEGVDDGDGFWQRQVDEADKTIKLAEKLVGDEDKPGDAGKLWYYIQSEEELGR